MGKEEGEEEGILCTDLFEKATLDDIDYNGYDVNTQRYTLPKL